MARPKFDTSFDFGFNAKPKGTGKKVAAPKVGKPKGGAGKGKPKGGGS
jgi:hypothetical protein